MNKDQCVSGKRRRRKSKRAASRLAVLDPLVRKMYADYRRGLTLREVGAKYGGRDVTVVSHLFRVRGLKTRRRLGPEVFKKIAATRRTRLDARFAAMHADYMRPMSLAAVGLKYGLERRGVREGFERRGLYIRPSPCAEPVRLANGQIAPCEPFTDRQIDELIAKETKLRVPPALKHEWRSWSIERRGWFIQKLRAKLQLATERPNTPFSSNVEPFDYTTPRAREIVKRMNAGKDSRSAVTKLNICTQGVIFRDELWFWCSRVGYQKGIWTPTEGRPILHHAIWKEHHGEIPASHVIRFADGNENNLAVDNLILATRNDVARENQAASLAKSSRERTSILLNRSQEKDASHELCDSLLAKAK